MNSLEKRIRVPHKRTNPNGFIRFERIIRNNKGELEWMEIDMNSGQIR